MTFKIGEVNRFPLTPNKDIPLEGNGTVGSRNDTHN